MLFKNICRRTKWDANRNLGLQEGKNASGGVWRPKCGVGCDKFGILYASLTYRLTNSMRLDLMDISFQIVCNDDI